MNKVKFSQLFLKKLVPMIIIMLFLSFLAFSEGIGYKVINESSETYLAMTQVGSTSTYYKTNYTVNASKDSGGYKEKSKQQENLTP